MLVNVEYLHNIQECYDENTKQVHTFICVIHNQEHCTFVDSGFAATRSLFYRISIWFSPPWMQ